MWDLFDFNNDGKVSHEEIVIGVHVIEGTFYDKKTPSDIIDYGDVDGNEIEEVDELGEDNDLNVGYGEFLVLASPPDHKTHNFLL